MILVLADPTERIEAGWLGYLCFREFFNGYEQEILNIEYTYNVQIPLWLFYWIIPSEEAKRIVFL